MNYRRFLYLIFKTEDFSDFLVYAEFLLISSVVAIIYLMLVFEFSQLIGESFFQLLGLGKDWNPLLKNVWVTSFIYLLLTLIFFIGFYYIYNIRKFLEISISTMLKFTIILFLVFVFLKSIKQYILNINLYLLNVSFMIILMLSLLIFILFFVPLIFTLSVVFKKDIPIKTNFQLAHLSLKNLIENSYKNINDESQEIAVQKRLFDICLITDYYIKGIKELKKSYGNAIYFDNIICLDNEVNLNEILDQLALSIPYYIFYGKSEQMKELNQHLETINDYLDVKYSVAGYPFINEIIHMNNKIKKYFENHSFKLQPLEKNYQTFIKRYYKKIFFSLLIPLVIFFIEETVRHI